MRASQRESRPGGGVTSTHAGSQPRRVRRRMQRQHHGERSGRIQRWAHARQAELDARAQPADRSSGKSPTWSGSRAGPGAPAARCALAVLAERHRAARTESRHACATARAVGAVDRDALLTEAAQAAHTSRRPRRRASRGQRCARATRSSPRPRRRGRSARAARSRRAHWCPAR